jgi:hypothetical protein
LKSEIKCHSVWHNILQGALYLLAFLTFGLGDAITCSWLIEQRGIEYESNPIVRFIIYNYSVSSFIDLKIIFTLGLLFITFMIQISSYESVYWIINAFLASLIIGGTISIILNIQVTAYEIPFLTPEQAVFIFIVSIFILTRIGEEIDER